MGHFKNKCCAPAGVIEIRSLKHFQLLELQLLTSPSFDVSWCQRGWIPARTLI